MSHPRCFKQSCGSLNKEKVGLHSRALTNWNPGEFSSLHKPEYDDKEEEEVAEEDGGQWMSLHMGRLTKMKTLNSIRTEKHRKMAYMMRQARPSRQSRVHLFR
ncbi:hypothetical protein ILYODFUR_005072 [Ilyodon furcidens]|uniref:Uncharacterized protein n=1 Tax=Ilyodon furcidens TaxID=33524 RepID=A0ABV0VBV0_9TELE